MFLRVNQNWMVRVELWRALNNNVSFKFGQSRFQQDPNPQLRDLARSANPFTLRTLKCRCFKPKISVFLHQALGKSFSFCGRNFISLGRLLLFSSCSQNDLYQKTQRDDWITCTSMHRICPYPFEFEREWLCTWTGWFGGKESSAIREFCYNSTRAQLFKSKHRLLNELIKRFNSV